MLPWACLCPYDSLRCNSDTKCFCSPPPPPNHATNSSDRHFVSSVFPLKVKPQEGQHRLAVPRNSSSRVYMSMFVTLANLCVRWLTSVCMYVGRSRQKSKGVPSFFAPSKSETRIQSLCIQVRTVRKYSEVGIHDVTIVPGTAVWRWQH